MPWIGALRWNAGYASALAPNSLFESVAFHFSSVVVPTALVMLTAGLLLCLTAWALRRNSDDSGAYREFVRLMMISSASFVIGLAVVAMSGLWPHHGLVFMIPICLSLVMFSVSIRDQVVRVDGSVLLATGIAALLLSGLPSVKAYLDPILYFRGNAVTYFTPSAEAELIMSTGTPTSYARVGRGDGQDHALGLNEWKLACPFFTQFTWESSAVLDATLNCLPNARVILVEANLLRR